MILSLFAGIDLEKKLKSSAQEQQSHLRPGKLLGAVANAWPYGKTPASHIIPFVQMKYFWPRGSQ